MENSIIWIIGMKERGLRNRTAYIEFEQMHGGLLAYGHETFYSTNYNDFFTAYIDQPFNHERATRKNNIA